MKIPEAYQIRVFQEREELQERVSKLTQFMFSDNFSTVNLAEQARLTRQLEYMDNYLRVLTERIEAM